MEIDAKPPLDLSLFHLDRELTGLLEYREERLADKESPATPEEMTSLDGEIRRYMEALPRKVSGVVAVKRNWRAQKAAAKAEIDRLRAIVAHLESMETRLDEYCAEVLESQPEPRKGCKKLTGADGSVLMLKGNGGLQPLQIEGWDSDKREWVGGVPPLPIEYKTVIAKIPSVLFPRISGFDSVKVIGTEPNTILIRDSLNQSCEECIGAGFDPADTLLKCPACGGSGKQGVPGARLLERVKHIEIR